MFGLFISVTAIVGGWMTIGWSGSRVSIGRSRRRMPVDRSWWRSGVSVTRCRGRSRVAIGRSRRRMTIDWSRRWMVNWSRSRVSITRSRSVVKWSSSMQYGSPYVGLRGYKREEGQDSECLKYLRKIKFALNEIHQ